jgi:hypothetical protein
MARLWRDQGKRDAARDLLSPVYGWFTERFDHARSEGGEGTPRRARLRGVAAAGAAVLARMS